MPPKPLKFAIIADIHIGDAQEAKPPARFPERARSLLRYVVSQLNTDKPDFVVQLGDLIESTDQEEDEDNISTAVEILRGLQMPVYHALGNHEQTNIPPQKVCSLLKLQRAFYSFKSAGVHGVVLCPERNGDDWQIGKEQLKWLDQELRTAESEVIVFSHFPLIDHASDDDAEPLPVELSSRADVRNLLAQSNKVRTVFGAHWHQNHLEELGGIHYVTVQSLVQNVTGSRPSESFTIAKFLPDQATVEVVGMDPAEFRL